MNDASGFPPRDWRLTCRDAILERGGRSVLRDVSLTLAAGECLALIGPNGTGKTTLLLAMLGLLPPAGGEVCLAGRPVCELPARLRGRCFSYVPQSVDRIPAFSVYDVVAAARFPHIPPLMPLSPGDRDAVEQALRQCGLQDLARRPITEVSGGERQKALLAAAIAQDAQAMFLDEPDTALDPAYQIELVRLLRQWLARGRALVLVSHDLQLTAELEARVVALAGGRVALDGPADEVLTPSRLEAIFGAGFEYAHTGDGRRFVLPRWPQPSSER
jgi:iron complex transport system ATP-binding protein